MVKLLVRNENHSMGCSVIVKEMISFHFHIGRLIASRASWLAYITVTQASVPNGMSFLAIESIKFKFVSMKKKENG